jgi:hypothetical protein
MAKVHSQELILLKILAARGPLLPIRKVLGFLMLVRNEDEDEDEERYRNRAGSA